MGQQTIKQRARQQAATLAAEHRRERAAREKRLQDLAVQVFTAVGERDAAVAQYEQAVGAALQQMTEVEGLTLREALDWCGDQVPTREATRLRQIDQVEQAADAVGEQGSRVGSAET